EFCYKFNRMYFGDRLFDRLMLASISYKPTFTHRRYGAGGECG
ncbi:MAG: IS1595 family transposase, partial [Bacteroidales bacterium]|nr:IS1595 family transposase [Bacteroidales bacterium]MBQ3733993.1 IS1595 family transposase [Bacteroidales bacterium]MBQ3734075.1 IS1595 family transposase [Bacteroidales bacterium]MBQ3734206.1 IS1595 family transposase [Bacteroidales bacterium]